MIFTAGALCWAVVCFLNVVTYNDYMGKIIRAINALSVWIGLITCGIALWEDALTYSITGGVLFVGGIITVLVSSSDPKFYYKILSIDPQNEPQAYLYCVLSAKALKEMKNQKRRAQFLKRAFISQHLLKCQEDICPLTNIKDEFCTNRKEDLAKHMNMVALYIGKMYRKEIDMYPKSVRLRIIYADYLMRYLGSLPEAWGILTSIKDFNKNVVENFDIYFLTKTIKKMALNQRNEYNAINMILQEKREAKFVKEVEKTAELYREFWSTLSVKTPDYARFEEIGFKMLKKSDRLEKLWSLFKNQNTLSASTLWLYSLYCEKIQTDTIRAEEIKDSVQHKRLVINTDKSTYSTYSTDSPLITASQKLSNLGNIRKYNAAFSSILGYGKNELVNAPLIRIIPAIYQKSHEEGIRDLYCKIESGQSYHVREIDAFALAKTGYIVPFVLKMIELPNFSNDRAFIVALTINKALLPYNIMHLLLDENKIVKEISSSCSSHLGITLKDIRNKTININEIVPEFEEMLEKKPMVIKHKGRNMKCHWSSIITSKKVLLGYHAQLELQEDDCSMLYLPENLPSPEFQFSYSFKYNKYIGATNIDKSPHGLSHRCCISSSNCHR